LTQRFPRRNDDLNVSETLELINAAGVTYKAHSGFIPDCQAHAMPRLTVLCAQRADLGGEFNDVRARRRS
jgi:hypothetical protein